MDWEAGMAIFEAILPVTKFLLANGPAFGFAHEEWINLVQWIAGAPLNPDMDRLCESEGPLAERLRWITPPHEVPEKKWQPFIATTMSVAKRLVPRPAELKTTAVSMPLTMDIWGKWTMERCRHRGGAMRIDRRSRAVVVAQYGGDVRQQRNGE